MFLMKVIQKIRFALVIENEIFYINGSETLPPPLTREEEQHIMENIVKGFPPDKVKIDGKEICKSIYIGICNDVLKGDVKAIIPYELVKISE